MTSEIGTVGLRWRERKGRKVGKVIILGKFVWVSGKEKVFNIRAESAGAALWPRDMDHVRWNCGHFDWRWPCTGRAGMAVMMCGFCEGGIEVGRQRSDIRWVPFWFRKGVVDAEARRVEHVDTNSTHSPKKVIPRHDSKGLISESMFDDRNWAWMKDRLFSSWSPLGYKERRCTAQRISEVRQYKYRVASTAYADHASKLGK